MKLPPGYSPPHLQGPGVWEDIPAEDLETIGRGRDQEVDASQFQGRKMSGECSRFWAFFNNRVRYSWGLIPANWPVWIKHPVSVKSEIQVSNLDI